METNSPNRQFMEEEGYVTLDEIKALNKKCEIKVDTMVQ